MSSQKVLCPPYVEVNIKSMPKSMWTLHPKDAGVEALALTEVLEDILQVELEDVSGVRTGCFQILQLLRDKISVAAGFLELPTASAKEDAPDLFKNSFKEVL